MKADFDVIVIGGGLAGLCLTIQLAQNNRKVLLVEKEIYPFHKVCGEYISMESAPFLKSLGFDYEKYNLPVINKLSVSTPTGKLLNSKLEMGGFGVSRYLLDSELYQIALSNNAVIITGDKVTDHAFLDNAHHITLQSGKSFNARAAVGSYGKRSNIDKVLSRAFIEWALPKKQNYIGVKYHIRYNTPEDQIALHNFADGYCGISRIEEGKSCLCYLTTAANVEKCNNQVALMEKKILMQNPHLKAIFENAEMLYEKPLVISQINFTPKELVNNHVLFCGDAAGLITPLCGNGMSMAMHGSVLLSKCLEKFLENRISQKELEKNYTMLWNSQFKHRLTAGRIFQRMFGSKWLTEIFIALFKPFPFIVRKMIGLTHGEIY